MFLMPYLPDGFGRTSSAGLRCGAVQLVFLRFHPYFWGHVSVIVGLRGIPMIQGNNRSSHGNGQTKKTGTSRKLAKGTYGGETQ